MVFNRFLGEFKEKALETAFIRYQAGEAVKYVRPVILALGLLFFLFIIPDYYLTENKQTFGIILAIRAIFLLLVVFLYLLLKYRAHQYHLLRWISLYKLIVSLCFLLVYYFYETPNFFIQSFGVVALILAFFNVTNRWPHAVFISLILGAGFIATTAYRPEEIPTSELAAVSVYIAIVLLMSSISAYRINIYKRMQYANNKELERMSDTDSLTGIYTRGKYDREAKQSGENMVM